ncbi:hypothetical protein EY643_10710 [Halioglobus maricola]|uniref:AttH domain-containing protein n=1 Tax=Halioglobus maricola TaxID=2601894 RepID=A0A5P9NKS6_9GAMM|nr:hypothetical protein [Halioglobus maricola]QFU76096.1 hypothetical protein EY643_10710 [Halioglobus maricola]
MSKSFDVSQFGIAPEDEYTHPFSPDHLDWNESYFFDWYNEDATFAGHCRIGWHPGQQRVLFWLFVYQNEEWLMIEECRLPLSELKLDSTEQAFSYKGWGLQFSYTPQNPLLSGTLNVSGFARVISGKRLGMVLPVAVDLQLEAVGAPHSRGAGEVESHSAQGYSTNRYEQPIQAQCEARINGLAQSFTVRGERDHSWGPRPWDMEWSFLVINNKDFSLQATVVKIPEWPAIKMGYFKGTDGEMRNLTEVDFQLEYNAENPQQAVQGHVSLTCDNDAVISAEVNAITGTEIDITHTFDTPNRTEYRRSLVNCRFHGDYEGVVSPGWFECNRHANDNAVEND